MSYYTPEQQQHLDLLHSLSWKYIGENYDYGNTLSSLRALYGDYYSLKNNHERVMKSYSELVEKYTKLAEKCREYENLRKTTSNVN